MFSKTDVLIHYKKIAPCAQRRYLNLSFILGLTFIKHGHLFPFLIAKHNLKLTTLTLPGIVVDSFS